MWKAKKLKIKIIIKMYLNSLKSTYFEFLVFTQMECFCSGAMGTQNSDIFSELR